MQEEKIRNLIRKFISEMEEKELDEMTVTDDIAGYDTPHAFSGNEKNRKKRLKKGLKSSGYPIVSEKTMVGRH